LLSPDNPGWCRGLHHPGGRPRRAGRHPRGRGVAAGLAERRWSTYGTRALAGLIAAQLRPGDWALWCMPPRRRHLLGTLSLSSQQEKRIQLRRAPVGAHPSPPRPRGHRTARLWPPP
jgi:hypothetical protein